MTTIGTAQRIVTIWLPGNGNAYEYRHQVGCDDVTEITLHEEYHGEYSLGWLTVHQGAKVRKIAERQVTEIVFEKAEVKP